MAIGDAKLPACEEEPMSTYYALVSALIFAAVAAAHLIRTMGRAAWALFGPDVGIVDWPCDCCPDVSLGLCAIRALGCGFRGLRTGVPTNSTDIIDILVFERHRLPA
jgi:hypothetical protein